VFPRLACHPRHRVVRLWPALSLFAQRIHDGAQVEEPDDWLRYGSAWELERAEIRYPVGLGGRVVGDGPGRRWLPAETLQAGAFDFVVPGHGTTRVSVLRLWQPLPPPIDLHAFSRGDHVAAGLQRLTTEALGWVLYPDDSTPAGRELRLKQEYFLVSASLQDVLARHLNEHDGLDNLGEAVAIHLNDTHPALAAPELLRQLLDEHNLSWERALPILNQVMSYTNHTLMPEALETWPVHVFEHWLPRHLEIIYEMNKVFLDEVRTRFPGDEALVRRVSLIDEGDDRRVRMAALSIVASHKVNGVSKLHSDLMVQTIFADYARIFPDRFINVTNGVTPRRWVAQANPPLAAVLDGRLDGPRWRTDLDRLGELAILADEPGLQQDVLAAKRANKERLAALVRRELGLAVDPESLFDVQVKRIHEYKRQLLNVLQVIAHYQAIVNNPSGAWTPRVVFFAGKAASAYIAAKDIIRLIHDVARIVNSDRLVQDRLKVVFLPNYSVSLAETIIPAADLSQQISTAGTEASGTGNMKFALNGALTIGTWDGANIEMAQAVGREHFFIFGLTADQASELRAGGYDPRRYYRADARLKAAVDAVSHGQFSPGEPNRYRGLVDSLLHRDVYLLFADFASYLDAHARADRQFIDTGEWARKAILNIAGMGQFSSDRTIRDYAQRVWNVAV
jgi:glycogen phosphorylase